MEDWRTINGVPVLLEVSDAPLAKDVYKTFGLTAIAFNKRSFTIPNASCPECGEPVFFYVNDYGSRVFFDELGPPWPKHPCTDLKAESVIPKGAGRARRVKEEYLWESDGWRPFCIKKIKRLDDHLFELKGIFIGSKEIEVFVVKNIKGVNLGSLNCFSIAMIRASGDCGYELSVLGDDTDIFLLILNK